MILEQGHSLAMVEMNPTVGQGIFGVVFNDIYSRIKPYDPEVYTSHRLTAVTDTGVTVEDMATGETKTIAADTVVLAMGTPQPGGHGGVLPGRRTERHSGGQRRDAGPHCRCYPGWL